MNSDSDIKKLLNLSEEELYTKLGREFAGNQAFPSDTRELVERGRRLFNAQIKRISPLVCENNTIKKMVNDNSEDSHIVMEIVNLIASIALPVAPINLAVLLVKRGVKKCCENYWEN